MLLAAYGTLKKGMSNHGALSSSRYIGRESLTCIALYDLGLYPAAVVERSEGICVEVYDISQQTLVELDEIEEYNSLAPELGLYNRYMFETRYGAAWVYIYNGDVRGRRRMECGSWSPSVTYQELSGEAKCGEH